MLFIKKSSNNCTNPIVVGAVSLALMATRLIEFIPDKSASNMCSSFLGDDDASASVSIPFFRSPVPSDTKSSRIINADIFRSLDHRTVLIS